MNNYSFFIKNSLLFLFLLSCTTIYSQTKIKEGYIEYSLISAEIIDSNSVLTQDQLKQFATTLEAKISMSFYWNEDYVTVLKYDPISQDTLKGTVDIKAGKMYDYKTLMGEKSYTVQEVPETNKETFQQLPEAEKDFETILGLKCNKTIIEIPGSGYSELLCAEDLDFSQIDALTPLMTNHGFLARTRIISDGAKIEMGIKTFSPKIEDESIFFIDTLGRTNFSSMKDDFTEGFEKWDEEEKRINQEFGEFIPAGLNNNILQNLQKDGYLNAEDYKVNGIIEDKTNIDKTYILNLLLKKTLLIEEEPSNKIDSIFDVYDLNSPSIKLILKNPRWKYNPSSQNKDAILVAYSQDYLKEEAARKLIFKNLLSAHLITQEAQSLGNEYINGKVGLETLISEMKQFHPLDQKTVVNDDQLVDEIRKFYLLVEDALPIKVLKNGDNLIVSDGKYEHQMPLNDFKTYDYNNSTSSESIYLDTVNLDLSFYQKLLPFLKQIGADHNLNKTFSIYTYDGIYHHNIEEYDIDDIAEIYPVIDRPKSFLFLNTFEKGLGDPLYKFGVSFDFHPLSENEELYLDNPFIGDVDAGIDYITTPAKLSFIKYMTDNAITYNLSKDDISEFSTNILNSLVNDSDELLNYLPNIKISVNRLYDKTSRSQYEPMFDEKKNDFKHAYPSFHEVLKDDFIATAFEYDTENHKVNFMYKGEAQTIDPGNQNMLDFIRENLKESKSGRKFFFIKQLSVIKKEYYYLTEVEATQLRQMLDVSF